MLLNRYRLEDWLSCTKAPAFPVIGMGIFASGAKPVMEQSLKNMLPRSITMARRTGLDP
jgi:hypothetical protein